MSALLTMRLVLGGIVCLFTLIDFAILCYLTSITVGGYIDSFALGIATCLLTLIAIGGSQAVERIRKGAITSLVWFELLWVGFLWVMWMATSGSVTAGWAICFWTGSDGLCRAIDAVKAFSWLNWLAFFIWFWTLLVSSIIANSRGNPRIWHTPTSEAAFTAVNEKNNNFQQAPYIAPYNTGSTTPGPQQQTVGYAPSQQYGGTPAPQQYPQQGYPQQGYGQPTQV